MTAVYILAHYDDEYCALPLIWEAAREGLAQRFIYLADYADSAMGARRLAETRDFLAAQGLGAETVIPLGLGRGAFDKDLHRHAGRLHGLLAETLGGLGPIARLVTPAWEGGHMDHDTCATLASRLGEALQVPVRQFTLYNGPGLPGPLLRGGAPLRQNGPRTWLRLGPGQWLRWMAGVRAFPSQVYAWSGIWPAMFAGMATRGFVWQGLTPDRVLQRPHPGSLFYERMFGIGYDEVRAALDEAFPVEAAVSPRASG